MTYRKWGRVTLAQIYLNLKLTWRHALLSTPHYLSDFNVRFMSASAKCRLASKPYEPRTVQLTVTLHYTTPCVTCSTFSLQKWHAHEDLHSNCRRRTAGADMQQRPNVWPRNSPLCVQHNAAADCIGTHACYFEDFLFILVEDNFEIGFSFYCKIIADELTNSLLQTEEEPLRVQRDIWTLVSMNSLQHYEQSS